jgi:hypothetical protein
MKCFRCTKYLLFFREFEGGVGGGVVEKGCLCHVSNAYLRVKTAGWLSWWHTFLQFQGSPVHILALTFKKLVSNLVFGLAKWFRGAVVVLLSEFLYSHM